MRTARERLPVRDGYLRGSLLRTPTARQVDVLAAFVAAGGSVAGAAEAVGIQPSTAKRHLADLRARSGLTTEQLIYSGRAEGWLVVPSLEPSLVTAPESAPRGDPHLRLQLEQVLQPVRLTKTAGQIPPHATRQ